MAAFSCNCAVWTHKKIKAYIMPRDTLKHHPIKIFNMQFLLFGEVYVQQLCVLFPGEFWDGTISDLNIKQFKLFSLFILSSVSFVLLWKDFTIQKTGTDSWNHCLSAEKKSSCYKCASLQGESGYMPQQKWGWIFKWQELGVDGTCVS